MLKLRSVIPTSSGYLAVTEDGGLVFLSGYPEEEMEWRPVKLREAAPEDSERLASMFDDAGDKKRR